MKNGRTTRKVTCILLDMMDEGIIDPRTLTEMCLNWMSESDVAEMAASNDLFVDEEEGTDGEEG